MKNRGEAKGGSREKKNKWKRIQDRKHIKAENIFEQSLPYFRLSTLEKPFYLV
jgi:hypothetical protein